MHGLAVYMKEGLPFAQDLSLENSSQATLLRWLSFLLGSQTVILTVLLFWIFSSDASICSTMAFPPLGNSDHVVVSVSIDFLSYSQWNALFHHIAYD